MKKIYVIMLTAIFFMLNGISGVYGGTTASFSLPFTYQWGQNGLIRGQKYQVILKTSDPETPMPQGSSRNQYAMELSEKETQEVFPKIVYTKPGDYRYTVEVIRGDQKKIQSYYIHVQVMRGENGELQVIKVIRSGNGTKIASMTIYDPASKKLSDTEKPNNNHKKNSSKENPNEPTERNKKGKESKSVKTGDEQMVEIYLVACIASFVMLLMIGKKRKNIK